MVNVDDLVRCHSDVVPDYTTFTLRPRKPDSNGTDHQKATNCLETHVNIKQKSRSHVKGITIDIAVDLDGGPVHKTQGIIEYSFQVVYLNLNINKMAKPHS